MYELNELEYKPIAICLCETWLTDNDPLGLYQIEGYQPVEVKNRPDKRGGGMAVFVRNDMKYSLMNFLIDIEHMVSDKEARNKGCTEFSLPTAQFTNKQFH